jgi:hypothetical protein
LIAPSQIRAVALQRQLDRPRLITSVLERAAHRLLANGLKLTEANPLAALSPAEENAALRR